MFETVKEIRSASYIISHRNQVGHEMRCRSVYMKY